MASADILNELPGKAVSYYGGTAQRGHSTRASLRDYKAQRRRSMDETMRVIRKVGTGRKLSSEDLESPFFENE